MLKIIVNGIQTQNKGAHRKDTLLSRNVFGLFRDRVGKFFDNKIPTEGPRRVYIRVDRDIGHPGDGPYVPSKRGRQGGIFRGR